MGRGGESRSDKGGRWARLSPTDDSVESSLERAVGRSDGGILVSQTGLSRRDFMRRAGAVATGTAIALMGGLGTLDQLAYAKGVNAKKLVKHTLKELNDWRSRTGYLIEGKLVPMSPLELDGVLSAELAGHFDYLRANGFQRIGKEDSSRGGTDAGKRAARTSAMLMSPITSEEFRDPLNFVNRAVYGLNNRYRLSLGLSGEAFKERKKKDRKLVEPVGIAYAEGKGEKNEDMWILGINMAGVTKSTEQEWRPIVGPVGKKEPLCYTPESSSPLDDPGVFQYGPLVSGSFWNFPARGSRLERSRIVVKKGRSEVELASQGIYNDRTAYAIIANPKGKMTTYEVSMEVDVAIRPEHVEKLKALVGDEAMFDGSTFRVREEWKFKTGRDRL